MVPYAIDGMLDEDGRTVQVFSEHRDGLDLYLDLGRIDAEGAQSLQALLRKAIAALEQRKQ